MKRITLFTVLMLAIAINMLNAQTNQGKVLVGVSSTLNLAGNGSDLVNIGFSTVKYKSDADGFEESDPDKMTSINFSPKVGYFIADNFAIGLDVNAAFSKEKDGDDMYTYSSTLISAGPFVRYYIPTSTVLPFFELGGSYGTVNSKYEYGDNFNRDDNESKSSIMTFGGGVGLAAPLGERASFDVLVGYNSLTVKSTEDNEDNNRNVIGTIGLKIGITILLGAN